MKYICNKVKSGHCKDVQALSKCVHAVPHDIVDDCTKEDDCFRHCTRKGESIKVKCIKY